MNYEQKYKEALERARECMKDGGISQNTIDYLCNIFPELAESEDERIKKEIIDYIKTGTYKKDWIAWLEKQCTKEVEPRYENLEELLVADNIYQMAMNDAMVNEAKEKAAKALSELCIGKLLGFEKQGEQNTANKVEPKFKVGDWVVYDHRTYQVVELPKEGYINLGLRRNEKIEFAPSTYCRPWTIQAAWK